MKKCRTCGEEKELCQFNIDKNQEDGLRYECKTCYNERKKKLASKKAKESKKPKKSEKPKKVKAKSSFELKDYHYDAMREFGNTIVSKKMDPEDIVAAFNEKGMRVAVRNFEKSYLAHKEDTHYVVEKI